MSRVQLALNVDDLAEAVAFYSQLFRTEPAKVRTGYANFAVADPPLKLVLIENPGAPGTLNHLGVEVATSAEIGSFADVEQVETSTCCFAEQDKVWVDGPEGHRWEVYAVLADSDTFLGDGACCAD